MAANLHEREIKEFQRGWNDAQAGRTVREGASAYLQGYLDGSEPSRTVHVVFGTSD